MTTITDIPVAEIRTQARQVDFTRVIVTFFAALFFVPGWIAGRTWYAAAFSVTALRLGFREGARLPPKQPGNPPGE